MTQHEPASGFRDESSGSRDAKLAPRSTRDLLLVTDTNALSDTIRDAVADIALDSATALENVHEFIRENKYRVVLVECAEDLVSTSIQVHKLIPKADHTALLAVQETSEGALDLLRYRPNAAAYAFLAAQKYQLRAHILELMKL